MPNQFDCGDQADAIQLTKRTLSAFSYAIQVLREEFFGFDFETPYEIDTSGGTAPSEYYPIFSDKLTWRNIELDAQGIVRTWNRTTGLQYHPAMIAWYALNELGYYHRTREPSHLHQFLKQVEWLEEHAVVRPDGAVVWPHYFDYPETGIVLRAPWISAFSQGLVISTLVRAWRVKRTPQTMKLLERAADIYSCGVHDGGVRALHEDQVFYTEVPGGPVPGILDGFLVSLIGLHDLSREIKAASVSDSFAQGIAGLQNLLAFWDYGGKWSWYGHRTHLCPPLYHHWNRALLGVLGSITGSKQLKDVASRWDPKGFTILDKCEVYIVQTLTKQLSRISCGTWRRQTIFSSCASLVPHGLTVTKAVNFLQPEIAPPTLKKRRVPGRDSTVAS